MTETERSLHHEVMNLLDARRFVAGKIKALDEQLEGKQHVLSLEINTDKKDELIRQIHNLNHSISEDQKELDSIDVQITTLQEACSHTPIHELRYGQPIPGHKPYCKVCRKKDL